MSSPHDAKDPLQIACEFYYYKPMSAFFNAFHLRAYQSAQPRLEPPVLDVGCSTGGFGTIFERAMRPIPKMTGVDLDERGITTARRNASHCYSELIVADAAALPFAPASFNTIVSNASMASFGSGVQEAAVEMHRVLRPGGRLYATLATNLYEENYLLPSLFRSLKLEQLAERSTSAINRRLPHFYAYTHEQWRRVFDQAGFKVARLAGFFPVSAAVTWGWLATAPMRVHSFLRYLPANAATRLSGGFYRRVFSKRLANTPVEVELDQAAYLLIVASKPE